MVLLQSILALKFNPAYHFKKLIYGHVIENINGFKMYLDLKNDRGISKDLFIFKKREFLSTDFLQNQEVIKPGDTILDIGANIGYYALLESRLTGPSGKVYAIEPVSNNYHILLKNIKLNSIKNIKTFKLAIGSERKKGEIYVADKGNISSFIYKKEANLINKEEVQIMTVDDFAFEHRISPDFIRMDVEGYEKEIIQGMPKTLLRKPKLFIEVHPHLMDKNELERMFSTIKKSGYSNAIVIKERNEIWIKKNREIKPLLRYLTRKIEESNYTLGMGKIEQMLLRDLQKTLRNRGSSFQVLLS